YYAAPVAWAVEKNITTGTSSTTFSPEEGCTRGQVVTFLWRAAGQPEPTVTSNPFKDVKNGDYFYKAVMWAVEKGVTTGTSTSTFSPEDVCTRGQIVTFMWRANGKPAPSGSSNPFRDVKSGDYFYEAVLWAVENKVTTGTSATTFSPDDTCTRGQVVTFLYRNANR
ncbi:MAG: S-layer homology domain-containing protein, partial [Clostridia bacterium]|nr:S-layer homology domain-containing protein [Clostridia bacterium]